MREQFPDIKNIILEGIGFISKWRLHMNNYGINTWSAFNNQYDYSTQLSNIEEFFSYYLTEPCFVLTPRFTKQYLSFRYCGLEVLQLTKRGLYRSTLYKNAGGKIRRRSPQRLESLAKLDKTMSEIHLFLKEKLTDPSNTRIDRTTDLVPGFSYEHWMESIFLSENRCAIQARNSIGLTGTKIENITSQVPVIKNPSAPGRRKRVDHIDIVAVRGNTLFLLELKKDKDIGTAGTELDKYTQWVTGKLMEADPKRGNLASMIEEGYMPHIDSEGLSIHAKIILVSNTPIKDDNYETYCLPDYWLQNAMENKNLFQNTVDSHVD